MARSKAKRNAKKAKVRARTMARAVAAAEREGVAEVGVSLDPEAEAKAKVKAALASIVRKPWFVVQTWANSEGAVERELRELGFDAYTPRETLKGTMKCRREIVDGVPRPRVVKVKRPIFWGYVFVSVDVEAGERFDLVRGVMEVVGLMSWTGSEEPTPISASEVEALRLAETFGLFDRTGAMTRAISEGDFVRLTGGKFMGAMAQVLRARPGEKRIKVMMECLGQLVPLDNVKMDHIELVGAKPAEAAVAA